MKRAAEEASVAVGEFNSNHVVLATFDEEEGGSLGSVTLRAFWKFDAGDSNVLMRTSTGQPLLTERSFGQGKVVVFASTCDRDWTNFPVRPAYLPWLYRLVGYLAQEPLARQNFFQTGDHVSVSVAATTGVAPWLVRKPDGTTGNMRISADTPPRQTFDDTQQPGVYTVFLPGQETQGQDFVANLEAYESDLELLDDVLVPPGTANASERRAQIETGLSTRLFPGRPLLSFVSDPARIVDESQNARRGLQLWDLVLLFALAVALFEPWFANHISLLRYFKIRQSAQRPAAAGASIRSQPARSSPPPGNGSQPTSTPVAPAVPEPVSPH